MLITFFAEHVLGQARTSDQAHLLRVEQTKIDRLADVAIGFSPGFANFENFQSGKFVAAPLHDVGGAFQQPATRFK